MVASTNNDNILFMKSNLSWFIQQFGFLLLYQTRKDLFESNLSLHDAYSNFSSTNLWLKSPLSLLDIFFRKLPVVETT